MRLSRCCYDKHHRCPGWAGGGTTGAKVELCQSGSIRVNKLDESGYPGHPGAFPWRFGHCTKCDVVTWPVVTRWLDPGWWRWEIKWFWRRVEDSWDDYQEGEPIAWIWKFRWKRFR